MFADRDLLKKELCKTIGFYQTNNSDYPTLSPSLITSTDNRFVNDVHGLIGIENIDQTNKNFSKLDAQTWVLANTYEQGDLVNDGDTIYEAVQNVPTLTPIADTDYWFALDNLNQYLWSKRLQGTEKALDQVFRGKKIRSKVKNIFENIALFDGVANYRNKETNNDKFVGLRFIMKSDRDIVTVINKIGHQFSEVVNFNLYLYHSSQQAPLATIAINHTSANSSQWYTPTDLTLRYLDDAYDAGGEFFLGYAQSELGTAQALNMYSLDWVNGYQCTSCSRSKDYWRTYTQYMNVMGFEIAESEFTVGSDLFDPEDITLTTGKNYGLNLNMTTKCDLTPFFIQEKNSMSEAIMYATGLEIMRDMASNVRGTNNLANLVREEARKQTVSFDGVSGTVFDFTNDALKAMSFDFSSLNSACLPCHNPVVSDGDYNLEIVLDNPFEL